jgi:hypothetical protein
VEVTIGRDHAFIPDQHATGPKVEAVASHIGDSSAGLLDDEAASRLIPDLVAKLRRRGKPDQELGLPSGDHGVLGLAIHQRRRSLDAERRDGVVERLDVDVVALKRPKHAGQARLTTG